MVLLIIVVVVVVGVVVVVVVVLFDQQKPGSPTLLAVSLAKQDNNNVQKSELRTSFLRDKVGCFIHRSSRRSRSSVRLFRQEQQQTGLESRAELWRVMESCGELWRLWRLWRALDDPNELRHGTA